MRMDDLLLCNDLDKYIWINDSWQEHREAQRLFDFFLKKQIYIKGFVTNSESILSNRMYHKRIYDIEILNQENTIVFFNSHFTDLDSDISDTAYRSRMIDIYMWECEEKGQNRFHHMGINEEIFCIDGGEEKRLFCLEAFWMFNHFEGKKIYIYGIGVVEKEFSKYLKLLDYDFAGFLIDETEEELSDKYSVQYVEEILYEENWYIWTYDKKKAKKLNDLGITYFKDYYVRDYRFDISIRQQNVLDVNLGHNYLSDSKYPGFMVYGHDKVEDYKIAVLGGSTTDGTMYPFKSWPQLLYEELGGKGVTVYNGGVCSYTSGQELIKLIRDVLQLKPDMVIVYDGYNDLAFNVCVQYPFTSRYMEEVFEYARMHMDDQSDYYHEEKNLPICRGISTQQDYFENWLSNIRTMYAILKERNISFFSFCQPVLSSKKEKTVRETNILLSTSSLKSELFYKESFRQRMTQLSDSVEYIYDLSHIFDGEDDVYMDVCHVWEEGNRIIAKEIENVIRTQIVCKIENSKV